MIQRIEHTVTAEANEIRRIFQISYKIEAQLLGAKNFPPLERPISGFEHCDNDFFGYYEGEKLNSRQKVYWQVKYWNQDGEASVWSEINHFELGLLNNSDCWKL